jgi:Fic family protein
MKIPVSPPDLPQLAHRLSTDSPGADRIFEIMSMGIGPAPDGKYRHWDILRHLTPPDGLTHEEWWFALKMARQVSYQPLPVTDKNGRPFRYVLVDSLLEMLHEVDRDAGGAIRGHEQVTNPQLRDTYIIKSLMEEAITSSQLEGAATTRQVAKEMIQTGRPPRTRGEQMIYNNYQAMLFIRRLGATTPLTPSIVLELHTILTEHAIDEPDAAGRLRRTDEPIEIIDNAGNVLHTPPDAALLATRLQAMCGFANGDTPEGFVHPVIRAIVLHFWLGYDHPFIDGNGRTARALFYWAMARQGYWLCEFLSISRILKKAPSNYNRAFLYTETDDNDLTYFVLNQLRVILRAVADLHAYLQRRTEELRAVEDVLRTTRMASSMINPRQLALLNHALKNPGQMYTFRSHQRSHGVSYQTARTDLLALQEAGLLDAVRRGRTYHFVSPADLRRRIGRLGRKPRERR